MRRKRIEISKKERQQTKSLQQIEQKLQNKKDYFSTKSFESNENKDLCF